MARGEIVFEYIDVIYRCGSVNRLWQRKEVNADDMQAHLLSSLNLCFRSRVDVL